MRKLFLLVVVAVVVGLGIGLTHTQALMGNDKVPDFYSSEYSLEERFAYELHVVIDGVLCDCRDEYQFPYGNGIYRAINKRISYLDATEEEKERLLRLAESYNNKEENQVVFDLEQQVESLEKQLESEKAKEDADEEKIDEIETELESVNSQYQKQKDVLKEEIQEIHDIVVKIDDRTNGDYYKSEHDRKGID